MSNDLLTRWLNPSDDPNTIYSELEMLEVMSAYHYANAHEMGTGHASEIWRGLSDTERKVWRNLTSEKSGYGVSASEKAAVSRKPTPCLTFPPPPKTR